MRSVFSERAERGRELGGAVASSRGDPWGRFFLRTNDGAELLVFVTAGDDVIPWDHVSVSTRKRCPTWDEMCWVKGLFFEDEETVMQLHPPKSEWISDHPTCLHLWRPLRSEIPRPPGVAVGLGLGEEKNRAFGKALSEAALRARVEVPK
jgi:hypothetical protein